MKFGVFFEIIVPRPWTPERERQAFENCVAQAKLADELGFQTAWVVEHHFFEEFSHASAPDLFLLAVARETKQIRLGHGIAICVPEINSAVRLAERAATLDILSGGRVEFGTGRAATWNELAGFRANPDYTKKTWDEFVRTIPKMWMEERFGYDGQYVKLPRRAVIPKPYQQPHPPMWAACGSRGTEIDSAERGIGALFLSFSGYQQQAERVKGFRERIARCDDPVGGLINNRATLVNFLYCHEDDEVGQSVGKRLAIRYGETGGQASGVSELYPTPGYSYTGDVRSALQRGTSAPAPQSDGQAGYSQRSSLRTLYHSEDARVPEGLCGGDPQRIIKALEGWGGTGIDEVSFLMSAGEIVTHQEVMDSLRLFGREVLPHFQNDNETPTVGSVTKVPVAR